jgi:hypothetical protein
MTTKAEDFRYLQERLGPKKPKRTLRERRKRSGASFLSRRNRSKSASRRGRSVMRAGRAGA